MTPRELVDAYLTALSARDYDRARLLLADEGFSYISPIINFDNADDFVEYLLYSGGVVADMEMSKVFVDGNDVCHFLLLTTYLGDKRRMTVVQWAQVADNRIRRLELIYDAHDYKQMLEQPQAPAD